MKYSTKINQAQLVGSVRIDPKGGELSNPQIVEIKKDLWGKELIRKGILNIEGVKPEDIVDEPKKGAAKAEAPKEDQKSDAGVNVDIKQGGQKE
jgi:hypothetical protein